MGNNITIISSDKNWLEQKAVEQLKQIAALPGVVKAVGLPDLHPGKVPVGTVLISENFIYPHIVGNDIGCGMSLFITGIEKRKAKVDRWSKKLEDSHSISHIDLPDDDNQSFSQTPFDKYLGTIGGGNHFAELQEADKVYDHDLFERSGFDKSKVFLLVHSGSRGYGESILDKYIKEFQAQKGLPADSEGAKLYMAEHNNAVKWAEQNRRFIAYKLLTTLGVNTDAKQVIDSTHNSLTIKNLEDRNLFIHRKGASPADNGLVVIPGSRGSLTYLVMPCEDTFLSGYSLAHGSGRKWERSMCKYKLEDKYTKETIKITKFKSRVVCSDNKLLFEEAPEAYKNIDTVIQSLDEAGLIKVVATFKPLLTYKV
ncbi:MAG: RNA ligase RtcB family protein [Clostridia bacterium]|nr:RNA ligase RtcB family protein [Clostridia bacterium]